MSSIRFAQHVSDYVARRYAPAPLIGPAPIGEMIRVWNEAVVGTRLARCRELTGKRLERAEKVWRSPLAGNLELWRAVCCEAAASEWANENRATIEHVLWDKTINRHVDRATSVTRTIPQEVIAEIERRDLQAWRAECDRMARKWWARKHGKQATLFDRPELDAIADRLERLMSPPKIDAVGLVMGALTHAA